MTAGCSRDNPSPPTDGIPNPSEFCCTASHFGCQFWSYFAPGKTTESASKAFWQQSKRNCETPLTCRKASRKYAPNIKGDTPMFGSKNVVAEIPAAAMIS